MKFIRFIIRALITWSLLMVLLGVGFAASPHAAEDVLGLLAFGSVAGGLLSRFCRPADAAAAGQTPVEAPPVVEAPAPQLPGARGAQMSLHQHPAAATPAGSLAVSFHGDIKAYVKHDSWHPVGDFAELGTDDPEYRLVALMSLYAQHVLMDPEGVYTEQDAVAYALGELVPHELLERDIPNPSHTAAALCLPVDVLTPQNLHALRAALVERNAAEVNSHDWQSAE